MNPVSFEIVLFQDTGVAACQKTNLDIMVANTTVIDDSSKTTLFNEYFGWAFIQDNSVP